ncbi:hypothetical protein ACFQ7I_04665 [Streptomyces massasporeus]
MKGRSASFVNEEGIAHGPRLASSQFISRTCGEAAAWAGVVGVGETAAATVIAAMPVSTLRRSIGAGKVLS